MGRKYVEEKSECLHRLQKLISPNIILGKIIYFHEINAHYSIQMLDIHGPLCCY